VTEYFVSSQTDVVLTDEHYDIANSEELIGTTGCYRRGVALTDEYYDIANSEELIGTGGCYRWGVALTDVVITGFDYIWE
jgi:predicted secreted protein